METSPGTAAVLLPPEPTATFPYRIIAKVGEGAMGEVFRAEDLDLHRQVAIKVVKLGRQSTEVARNMVQRFLQEARAAAAITHPNVPVIYRVGLEVGSPYIVMEWIDGETLEALLADGRRFTAEQASRLGIEILAALDTAHAAGIVHRDIKPGNLMLAHDGRVKVTDFGIARVRGESALAHTQAGIALGTPWYAAPEQLAGLAVDRRADLYGVGCVLHELVTGEPPYHTESIYELLSLIHAGEPPAPSTRAPGVVPGFDIVVQRALAIDPSDRFASARDMAAALGQLVSSQTATSIPGLLRRRASAPSVRRTATAVVDGATPIAIVTNVVRAWAPTPLGRRPTARLLERLVERPLHATPFVGAVSLDDAWLLVGDGLIYAAFDRDGGLTGDALLESRPAEVEATLHPVPEGLDPEVVPLLASILLAPRTRLANVDSSFADLPGLADKLTGEGFDGAVRLSRRNALGFVLFRKGSRVLDVFGAGWPVAPDARPWEDWIAESSVLASVDELRVAFPSVTFRQQLRGLALDVVRPSAAASGSLRSDAVAEARALELRPRDESRVKLRRGETALQALVDADPAYELARWALVELAPQFAQFGRAARWKALVDPIEHVVEVRLHHAISGLTEPFDVATFDDRGRWHHAIDHVALGTKAAVDSFVERALAAKAANPDLGAALLVAPQFEEAGLEAYVRALEAGRSRFGLDALRHREGFVRTKRGGLHLLLVEEEDGRRRPLVPQ